MNPRNDAFLARVFVTGGTGFVGRAVVRELVTRGHQAICLVRDRLKLVAQTSPLGSGRVEAVSGDLLDATAMSQALEQADAAIHLVGIIAERPWGRQTFQRIHVEGTRRVVEACQNTGVRRFIHVSALGTRPHAVSAYHRTKWEAECLVRASGLDWTLFRPSLIHGPDGEFMRLMRKVVCHATLPALGFLPMPFPVIPCFGDGQKKLQPVSVRDVAHCLVAALSKPETIGQVYELGGPEAITWKELYRVCRETMPGAKRWKPVIGQPVWAAKLMARTVMRLPILPRPLRFDVGQVQMTQEDSVCDVGPVEKTFGIRLRDFRQELSEYARRIA